MIEEMKDGVEDVLITGFLEDSVYEFEVCCRRAIESVLAAPTMNAGRFGLTEIRFVQFEKTCNIHSVNDEYSVTISLGLGPADLAVLVPGESELDMQLDALGEITNVLSGSFLTNHRFSERFGLMPPSLPFFVDGGERPAQKSWCIQGQLRVNSVRVFLGVAIGKTAREGGFPCKNPL